MASIESMEKCLDGFMAAMNDSNTALFSSLLDLCEAGWNIGRAREIMAQKLRADYARQTIRDIMADKQALDRRLVECGICEAILC